MTKSQLTLPVHKNPGRIVQFPSIVVRGKKTDSKKKKSKKANEDEDIDLDEMIDLDHFHSSLKKCEDNLVKQFSNMRSGVTDPGQVHLLPCYVHTNSRYVGSHYGRCIWE